MKRGYQKTLYNQRNKDETIFSVMKRLFGGHIGSGLIRTQNREITQTHSLQHASDDKHSFIVNHDFYKAEKTIKYKY